MNKQVLVSNLGDGTRVAVLWERRLFEVHFESPNGAVTVGNIYKGTVNRIVPGMQAAFVDIGFERDAFLYIRDVDERALLEAPEPDWELGFDVPGQDNKTTLIEDLLTVGQEIIVQIVRVNAQNKGPRITMQISLPGRYLVLLPQAGCLGISKRIQDPDVRSQLKKT